MRHGFLLLLGAAVGCSSPAQPGSPTQPTKPQSERSSAPDADHKDEPQAHEGLPTRVRLSPQVVAKAGVKTATAGFRALPQTLTLTGEVVADPDREAKVTVRVAGRIVDVSFKEGDRVQKGATLAVVESPELARARAAYTAAQAKARSARQNLERLRNVAEKGLASGQEVAAAEAETSALQAEERAARQTLSAFGPSALEDVGEAARLVIRAPLTGSVLSRDAIRGQTVTADHVIALIADLDKSYFVARLFEKDLARVKVGAAAEVRLNGYPNEVFEGAVEQIGQRLDPSARTVVARIAIKNRSNLLKVGLFGNALIVVLDAVARTPRVVVPLSATTKVADDDVVFVREADGDFEVHPVTLGRSAAGMVEVLSGLTKDEQVVVEGVFSLKSAVLKSTFGEEE